MMLADGGVLIRRDEFVDMNSVIHLATGGEGPVLNVVAAALHDFVKIKSAGFGGRLGPNGLEAAYVDVKNAVSSLLGCSSENIAITPSATAGVNHLAAGYPFAAGDSVVTIRDEYPSLVLPWQVRKDCGLDLIVVEPGDRVEDRVVRAITDRTRIVSLSYVNYLTGRRIDLEPIARECRRRGALLLLDASHALGVLPVPLELCDALVSCFYKFMLGIHGSGVMYLSDRALDVLTPRNIGWRAEIRTAVERRGAEYQLRSGAARFEAGNPSYAALFSVRSSICRLNAIDTDGLAEHVLNLVAAASSELRTIGLKVWTPTDRNSHGPNCVFGREDWEHVVTHLAKQGLLCWGGEGRVRLSFHGFNSMEDVDTAVRLIRAIVKQ